VVDTLVLHR